MLENSRDNGGPTGNCVRLCRRRRQNRKFLFCSRRVTLFVLTGCGRTESHLGNDPIGVMIRLAAPGCGDGRHYVTCANYGNRRHRVRRPRLCPSVVVAAPIETESPSHCRNNDLRCSVGWRPVPVAPEGGFVGAIFVAFSVVSARFAET